MKIIGIIFLTLILVFTPYQTFAQSDEFEIIGRTLTHDPTICALEPETDIKDAWKKLSQYTASAVSDWKNKLNDNTRARDVWNLDLQLISLEKQTGNINCDVKIEFLPKPQIKEDEFTMAGYTINNASNDVDIVIFFLNVELDRVDYTTPIEGTKVYYSVVEWTPRYTDYLATPEPLKMTIKHELGHALGLGHYVSHDENRLQKWYDGVERPPSIMISQKPTKVISASITLLDIEKLIQIYGKDGFYSEEVIDDLHEKLLDSQRITLPDWIRNNAKWWSDGAISDDAFVSGIEYMIKNKVIDVGVTGTNQFAVGGNIPNWVKQNASWWADGLIQTEEFVKGIQYLVQHGIIRV